MKNFYISILLITSIISLKHIIAPSKTEVSQNMYDTLKYQGNDVDHLVVRSSSIDKNGRHSFTEFHAKNNSTKIDICIKDALEDTDVYELDISEAADYCMVIHKYQNSALRDCIQDVIEDDSQDGDGEIMSVKKAHEICNSQFDDCMNEKTIEHGEEVAFRLCNQGGSK